MVKGYYNVDIKWDFTISLHLEDLNFKFQTFCIIYVVITALKIPFKSKVHFKDSMVNYLYT